MIKELFLAVVTSVLGTPPQYADIVYKESMARELDPTVLVSILHTETGGSYNPRAYNDESHTIGLMQIGPFWRRHYGMTRRELRDGPTNIRTGVRIYSDIKSRFTTRCNILYTNRWCSTSVRNNSRFITPLHFYRCRIRSARMTQCRRSVSSVMAVRRRLLREAARRQQ